jgi:hypothetical protein
MAGPDAVLQGRLLASPMLALWPETPGEGWLLASWWKFTPTQSSATIPQQRPSSVY